MNTNSSFKQSQQQNKNNSVEIEEVLKKYSDRLAKHIIGALRYMSGFAKQGKTMWFSQTTLGKKLGLSRNRTNVIVKAMEKEGLIASYYRQSKTCEYEVASYYLQPEQQVTIRWLFKKFSYFSITLVMSISAASQEGTQFGLNDNAHSNYTIQESDIINRGLSLLVGNWLGCLKKEGEQRRAGMGHRQWLSHLAPEETAHSGGTPRRSLSEWSINWMDPAYLEFEAQFLAGMPDFILLGLNEQPDQVPQEVTVPDSELVYTFTDFPPEPEYTPLDFSLTTGCLNDNIDIIEVDDFGFDIITQND